MVYKRVRGWTSGQSLPVWNFFEYPPWGGGQEWQYFLPIYRLILISQAIKTITLLSIHVELVTYISVMLYCTSLWQHQIPLSPPFHNDFISKKVPHKVLFFILLLSYYHAVPGWNYFKGSSNNYACYLGFHN